MSWSNTFTQSSNVNGGNEYTVYDVPTASMFNIPINNTQYLYDHKLEKENNDGMFYGKVDYRSSSPYLRAGDEGDSEYSELAVQSNGIYLTYHGSGTTTSYNIFDKITDIETRLANLGFKYPPASQNINLSVGGTTVLVINVTAGASGDRFKTSREGNRTVLKLQVNVLSGYAMTTNFQNFYRYGDEATTSQAIPEVYRPNVTQEFYIPSGRVEYRYPYQSTYYTTTLTLPIKITLGTDGIFKAQILTANMPAFPSQTPYEYWYSASNGISASIGYTNAPIS